MPRRGDNIHKRKDGRWEGRYVKNRDSSGKARYLSVYGKTYNDVKMKMKNVDKEPENTSVNKEEKTFKEILFLWMKTNSMGFKQTTENKYQYLIDMHILPILGDKKVSEITTMTVNTFLEEKMKTGRLDQKGGLSASYVRIMMLIINSALKFGAREDFCKPLKTPIYKPPVEKKEFKILSKEEQKKFERYLSSETDEIKLGILLTLQTGLRIGEVCALTWENIDFNEQIIHVCATIVRIKNKDQTNGRTSSFIVDRPKTAASIRDIPISSTLFPMILNVRKMAKSDFVISNHKNFLSPRTYEYRYHRLLSECGIEPINYHALRHTFATRCIEAGVDIKSLSEILGHTNVSITLNTYVHSSMDLKRKQIEKLVESLD